MPYKSYNFDRNRNSVDQIADCKNKNEPRLSSEKGYKIRRSSQFKRLKVQTLISPREYYISSHFGNSYSIVEIHPEVLTMYQVLLSFLALAALAYGLPNPEMEISHLKSVNPFVVGGQDAKPHEFPWQLSLQYLHSSGEFRHTCGASLYKTKYALTAAHCVDGRQNTTFRVVAGLHKRSQLQGSVITQVKSLKIHEKYNDKSSTYANDIAVLTLESEVKPTSTIKPATIPKDNEDKFVNQSCVISGWGRSSGNSSLPDTLQKGQVHVISNTHCKSKVANGKIGPGHVCILDFEGDTGACNGDSGGPVTCKSEGTDVVVGAASWVISVFNQCRPNYASVYTRFSEYLDWIKKHTP